MIALLIGHEISWRKVNVIHFEGIRVSLEWTPSCAVGDMIEDNTDNGCLD